MHRTKVRFDAHRVRVQYLEEGGEAARLSCREGHGKAEEEAERRLHGQRDGEVPGGALARDGPEKVVHAGSDLAL